MPHWQPNGANDIAESIALYDSWYDRDAPGIFKRARWRAMTLIRQTIEASDGFAMPAAEVLSEMPEALLVYRHLISPPPARARLSTLAGLKNDSIVKALEAGRSTPAAERAIPQLVDVLDRKRDRSLLRDDARDVLADRIAQCWFDSELRNAQEARQLAILEPWLRQRDYRKAPSTGEPQRMEFGTYVVRPSLQTVVNGAKRKAPIDVVVMPQQSKNGLPVLFELKSAGDEANTNKRSKEEGERAERCRKTWPGITYALLLGGHFGQKFLEHARANDIAWVWEHRVADLEHLGL